MYEHSDNNIILGVDVGGSHITAALLRAKDNNLIEGTLCRSRVENHGSSKVILDQWLHTMKESISKLPASRIVGMGFAMPGPFNYDEGICLMRGVNKYDSLFNFNIATFIRQQFILEDDFPVLFENDASCFGIGESLVDDMLDSQKIIAVTLGTGFGATFLQHRRILKEGRDVPSMGTLYDQPYLGGIAEDYISSAWILKTYNQDNPDPAMDVKEISERVAAQGCQKGLMIFEEFGKHFAACIIPWVIKFKPDVLVIGGSIAHSSSLFITPLEIELLKNQIDLKLKISTLMETSAIVGAASLVTTNKLNLPADHERNWRKSSQRLLPRNTNGFQPETDKYDMFPFYAVGENAIFSGYDSLAGWMTGKKTIVIDGYGGNDWEFIQVALDKYFRQKNISVGWNFTSNHLKKEDAITAMVAPFLGEPDGVWGTRTTLGLEDFYDVDSLSKIKIDADCDINILIGTGAALSGWENVVYIDLPKNEIQYRMRAGSITNLGSEALESPAMMYKRFYFVDWVVYNKHRQNISSRISLVADGQWKTSITWATILTVKKGLTSMSTDVIRARPWFEAGTWGGDWMKHHIPQINTHEINYAWSFELIAPENGVVFESDSNLLELSFDWLMEFETIAILGRDAAQFGSQFPIRFDFLDTFNGGNLSIQCHPSNEYIRENFGETITQDETYYILDCQEDAKVYLGFQEDIHPGQFKDALEQSLENNTALDIDRYVASFPAKKHDLFLIPNRTIHSAGVNNMVLEISATPYIFTFKMYDWVRLDLDGNPRPINIEHAFNNLDFTRKGAAVSEELISKQTVIHSSEQYRIVNLSTHADHFYKVERLEFEKKIKVETGNQCHVLMLVEGSVILVQTKYGKPKRIHYAETFIIPAAAEEYEITNESATPVKVVKAFVK